IFRVITRDFANIRGRKAMIVLTDGEIGGRTNISRFLDAITESDVVIYPVFFQTPGLRDFLIRRRVVAAKAKTISNDVFAREWGPFGYLTALAEMTGGRVIADDGKDLSSAFRSIVDELKQLYVIGFYPTSVREGGAPNISIDLLQKDAVVRLRKTVLLN